MKKIKFYYLLPILCLGVFVTSCNDDDDPDEVVPNAITITIEEPLNGEVIMDCSMVHVHVDFVATDENHEVEVKLHPEDDVSDLILDIHMHEHDKSITIEQEVDLCSYGAAACFHLEVEACLDHDCAQKETADVEFCLQ